MRGSPDPPAAGCGHRASRTRESPPARSRGPQLDLRAVLWLEEYLQRWKKSLVVVSHDREFLNTVCSDIIHLHDLKLSTYRGNCAQFESMYTQRRTEANRQFEKFEKQLKAAKASGGREKIDKVQSGAKARLEARRKARGGGGQEAEDDEGGAPDAPRAWKDYQVKFSFPTPTELPPPLIQLIDVSFKYPGRDDFGLKNVNLGVDMGTRVAIVGPNGAGKSTARGPCQRPPRQPPRRGVVAVAPVSNPVAPHPLRSF